MVKDHGKALRPMAPIGRRPGATPGHAGCNATGLPFGQPAGLMSRGARQNWSELFNEAAARCSNREASVPPWLRVRAATAVLHPICPEPSPFAAAAAIACAHSLPGWTRTNTPFSLVH